MSTVTKTNMSRFMKTESSIHRIATDDELKHVCNAECTELRIPNDRKNSPRRCAVFDIAARTLVLSHLPESTLILTTRLKSLERLSRCRLQPSAPRSFRWPLFVSLRKFRDVAFGFRKSFQLVESPTRAELRRPRSERSMKAFA